MEVRALCVPLWPLTLLPPVTQGGASPQLSYNSPCLAEGPWQTGRWWSPSPSQFQEELPEEKVEADPGRRRSIQQRERRPLRRCWWRQRYGCCGCCCQRGMSEGRFTKELFFSFPSSTSSSPSTFPAALQHWKKPVVALPWQMNRQPATSWWSEWESRQMGEREREGKCKCVVWCGICERVIEERGKDKTGGRRIDEPGRRWGKVGCRERARERERGIAAMKTLSQQQSV